MVQCLRPPLHACALVLFAALANAHAQQSGEAVVRIVYPPEPRPTAPIRPAAPKSAEEQAREEAARQVVRDRMQQREEYEARMGRILFLNRIAAQRPIDRLRDEYALYLEEKRRREEAQNDPELAAIRARYRDDSVRNDYLVWKQSQPERKTTAAPIGKTFDLFKYLCGTHELPAPAKKHETVKDE